MALQLPAVKKLGEEVGLNIADGVSGISRSVSEDDPAPKADNDTSDDK